MKTVGVCQLLDATPEVGGTHAVLLQGILSQNPHVAGISPLPGPVRGGALVLTALTGGRGQCRGLYGQQGGGGPCAVLRQFFSAVQASSVVSINRRISKLGHLLRFKKNNI